MQARIDNNLQAAILFADDRPLRPARLLGDWLEKMNLRGMRLSMTQTTNDSALFVGPHPASMFVSVEHMHRQADPNILLNCLTSPVAAMLAPDAAALVQRHRSHALLQVRHGVMPDMPEFSSMFAELGIKPAGQTVSAFCQRLDTASSAATEILEAREALLVHWTASNLLVAGKAFASLAQGGHPGLLTVHPLLIPGDPVAGYSETPVGLLTFGARNFVGREILVDPAPIPWLELYEIALAFIRIALSEGGYIIPHEDTFGPDDGAFKYRCTHVEADSPGAMVAEAHYRLTLEESREHGYATGNSIGKRILKSRPKIGKVFGRRSNQP